MHERHVIPPIEPPSGSSVDIISLLTNNARTSQTLQTPTEILAHMKSPDTGYYLNINPFSILGHTVYELVKASQIPTDLLSHLQTAVTPMVKEGFTGGGITPEQFAQYLFADPDNPAVISYLVTNSKNEIVSAAGRVVAEISLDERTVLAMNFNAGITNRTSEGSGIYSQLNDGILQRLQPTVVCTTTMNPRVVKSVIETFERNGYTPITAEPNLIAKLVGARFIGIPLPNAYGVREKHIPQLQSAEQLDMLWKGAEQFASTQPALSLLKAGIFQPKQGDQLFLIGIKL